MEAEKERLLSGNVVDEEKLVLKEEVSVLTVQKKSLETELRLAQNRTDELEKRLVFKFYVIRKSFISVSFETLTARFLAKVELAYC